MDGRNGPNKRSMISDGDCCGSRDLSISVQTSHWMRSAWDAALEISHYCAICRTTSVGSPENATTIVISHISLTNPVCNLGDGRKSS